MPDKNQLNYIVGNSVEDIRRVRLPGLDKPFERLTISELVQLRAGSEVQDSWSIEAVGSDISVSSSSKLVELGKIQEMRAVQQVVQQTRLSQLRTELAPMGIGGLSAQDQGKLPDAQSVRLPTPEEDVFSPNFTQDPFKS